jgi:Mg2+-importing ATPase
MPEGEASTRRGKWIVWLLGAALLGVVVSLAAHFSEEHAFARLLDEAQPFWLLAAGALQATTYLAEAQVWRVAVRGDATRLSLARLYRFSVAKLFVDQALPSGGVSGTLLYVQALQRAGVGRGAALSGVIVATFSYYTSYVLCLSAALIIGLVQNALTAPVMVVAIAFMFVSMAIAVFVLRQAGRAPSRLATRLEKRAPFVGRALSILRDSDPKIRRDLYALGRALTAQIAIVLLDAATIWTCLLAVGAAAQPAPVFVGYMFSSLLRTLSFVPGGLGAFEAASTYLLHAGGVSVEAALSATLLFRGLSFWLPMIPGVLFARQAASGRHMRDGLAS